MSRTREAPTPTNISTKSEPEMVKNGTLASPAIARASSVLPVPGSPTKRAPRGMRPPRFWNLCGTRRNSMAHPSLSAPGHVVEGDPAMALGEQLGLGLAEAHGAAAARLHLAHEEDPHGDQ